MSRQRAWQLKQIAAGLCRICGAKREHYTDLCDAHALHVRTTHRQRMGYKAKVPGGRGRKPLVADPEGGSPCVPSA